MERKLLSIIVPVYKSEDILTETHRRLSATLCALGPEIDHEMVFVNDGSPDGSLEVLRKIAASDPHVRVLSLSRNFKTPRYSETFFAVSSSVYLPPSLTTLRATLRQILPISRSRLRTPASRV